MNEKTLKILRLALITCGASFLVLSWLCFLYIIPGFKICGNACEYWWSWIIDFPPQGPCILVCVPRNWLYKPFFVFGALAVVSEIIVEFLRILSERRV